VRRLNDITFHPFLFALYPVLYLYSVNAQEVALSEIARSAVVLLGFAGVVLGVFWLLLRLQKRKTSNAPKAAVPASLTVMTLALYCAVYEAHKNSALLGMVPIRHRTLAPVFAVCFVLVAWSIIRTVSPLRRFSAFLNTCSALLLALPLVSLGQYAAFGGRPPAGNASARVNKWRLKTAPNQPKRDVYYIILDMYGRSDALRDLYSCDNSGFIRGLERRGFYVADQGLSNYPGTMPSLASSLNTAYVQDMVTVTPREASRKHTAALRSLIRDNAVTRAFKQAGYKVVFLPSGYQVTNSNKQADLVLRPSGIDPNEFERTLFNTVLDIFASGTVASAVKQTHYALDALERIPDIKALTFTFAHIVCPHPPYVFDENGNRPSVSETGDKKTAIKLYAAQMAYLDKRIERLVDVILAKSETPPIIIIQSDHGPRVSPRDYAFDDFVRLRSGILNAYYLPAGGKQALYATISPVNTFRLVFREYFGVECGLLPDTIYEVKGTAVSYDYQRVRSTEPR